MTTELKPCPLCGYSISGDAFQRGREFAIDYMVLCMGCGCCITAHTAARARSLWNRRFPAPSAGDFARDRPSDSLSPQYAALREAIQAHRDWAYRQLSDSPNVKKLDALLSQFPASASADGTLTARERLAIDALLEVARATHSALDNWSETLDDEGTCQIEGHAAKEIETALDLLESLPDDQPDYVMGGAAFARWSLRRLLDAAPTAEGSSAHAGVADPWRGMYLPERAQRDAEGLFWHPDLPTWDDDREDSIEPLVRAQGFEIRGEEIEIDDDIAMAGDERYWQALAAWQPERLSENWRLAAVADTEDGPAAWFVRPLALAGHPKAVQP